jgi:hypothetical protein
LRLARKWTCRGLHLAAALSLSLTKGVLDYDARPVPTAAPEGGTVLTQKAQTGLLPEGSEPGGLPSHEGPRGEA